MILLTHGYFLSEDEKELRIMKPYVPLGLLYLSGYLEANQVEHEVFDSTFSTWKEWTGYVDSKPLKVIGIYTNLMTKINVLKMVKHVKTSLPGCMVVLGGPEIRYNADSYLKNGADKLVIGEGEQTFFELCDSVLSKKDTRAVPGTAWLENGTVVYSEERKLLRSLDDLPLPARHKVDLNAYARAWKSRHGYSMFSVSTMRGCPYTCKWCSRAVYGGTYRRRSASLVVDEMEWLQKTYQPDRIWFVDDVFTISHKWLSSFHAEIVRRGLKLPFEIITRADRMNEEVIRLLKESGCFRVWIGAESGSQEIINRMDRRVDVNEVRKMIIATREAGILAGTFIMVGYPGEGVSHIRETIEHLKQSRPSEYTITLAYPITGTPFYEEVQQTVTNPAEWSMTTDRENEFRRTYSKRFYQLAIKWIHNEVNSATEKNWKKKLRFKSKALIARSLMSLSHV